jgi:hypothetical protein
MKEGKKKWRRGRKRWVRNSIRRKKRIGERERQKEMEY